MAKEKSNHAIAASSDAPLQEPKRRYSKIINFNPHIDFRGFFSRLYCLFCRFYAIMPKKIIYRGVNFKMTNCFRNIHAVFFFVMVFFIGFAVVLEPSAALFEGFIAILRAPDILVTDYVYVGGLGSAILNSALTSLLSMGEERLF